MLDEAPVEVFGATGEGELDLRVQRQISRWRCGWAQTGAAGLPQFQGLAGEGRRDRIDERQPLGALASEPVSPIHPGVGRIAIARLESGQLGCLAFGGGTIKRQDAQPIGIDPDAQQLGVHVGAFEFGGDIAQVPGAAFDAVAQGGRTARIGGARQQAFQEIAKRVQAVHHLRSLGMSGQEIAECAQRSFEHALVRFDEAGVLCGLEEIPPCHGGFQLVAGGRARPAVRIARHGRSGGQGEDGMEIARWAGEIACHGFAHVARPRSRNSCLPVARQTDSRPRTTMPQSKK